MSKAAFSKPINTIIGLGFLRPIRTIDEAYAFLMDWRGLRADRKAHAVALNAVKAAMAGEIEPDTARSFVQTFARKAGLLAPDMDAPMTATLSGHPSRPAH